MKQKALKVLSLTMALNILFSTMGMAFYEHTCLITTIKTISISSEDFCCEEDAGISSDNEGLTQLKQGSCCETTKVLKRTDSKTSFGNQKVKASVSYDLFTLSTPSFVSLHSFREAVVLPNSNAPPRHGRQLLTFIQTFLI